MAYVNFIGCDMCGKVLENRKGCDLIQVRGTLRSVPGFYEEEFLPGDPMLCGKCIEPLMKFRAALEEARPVANKRVTERTLSFLEKNQ